MPVFLGISTYKREAYLRQVLDALTGLRGTFGTHVYMYAVHDGPAPEGTAADECLPQRGGVAAVKNRLLERALDTDCDYVILAEDDIVPQSALAVTGYVRAIEASGVEHLNFAHHGQANAGGPVGTDPTGLVTLWPNYVGAWSVSTRRAVEKVGFLDEDLYLALEHVQWSVRMAEAGFCPLPEWEGDRRVADATGSEGWLSEIPGSIENSSILADGGDRAQRERFRRARATWKAKDPESYKRVFLS